MLKTTRVAALAAVLLIAGVPTLAPLTVRAQAQPSAPAAPAAPAPPAPAAAPAAPSPPRARQSEIVQYPYGLEALWKGGDMVAKFTLVILAIMSMGSWYIIITKVYEQYRMGRQARAAEKTFWKAASVREGADGL